MKYKVDLHSHTMFSDGSDSPETLVRAMQMSGVNVMALTDHDTTAGIERAIKEAERYGFSIIPGVEVSTTKYHILGLNIKLGDENFERFLDHIRKNQISECEKRIHKLERYGVPISVEKLKNTHDPSTRLGKWNIVNTLFIDSECRDFVVRDFGYLPAPRAAFEKYLGKNGIAARIKYDAPVHSKDAIKAIHDAGGIAIIAHPFKEVSNIEKELGRLREKGIDGLEIQPNFGRQNDPFRDYAWKNGWMMTYGSDFHGAGYNRPLLGNGNENEIDNLESMLNKWRR